MTRPCPVHIFPGSSKGQEIIFWLSVMFKRLNCTPAVTLSSRYLSKVRDPYPNILGKETITEAARLKEENNEIYNCYPA